VSALRLFEATGLEIEYMIVDAESLSVRPAADRALEVLGGLEDGEVTLGDIAWSNELALHVIELKGAGPIADRSGAFAAFQAAVEAMNRQLAQDGLRLLPTAMHPWMDPWTETKLWPHGNDEIYRAFDRIFDCRGHGWSNLQSMHINLPFADDGELGRLHAAVRLVLPLLPGLAASSPVEEGRVSGHLDGRLFHYAGNARRVPSVSGVVVPEAVFDRRAYEEELLGKIYRDLAPHDPQGILRHEWANARGAIVRFDRMALEIRVLDSQEHVAGDFAVAEAVVAAVRAQTEGRFGPPEAQRAWDEHRLAGLFRQAVERGEATVIEDAEFLAAWGFPGAKASLQEVWRHLVAATVDTASLPPEVARALQVILQEGTLARRILAAVGSSPERGALRAVYGRLADCLDRGIPFSGAAAG
jgi:carboxylate-amine ligase